MFFRGSSLFRMGSDGAAIVRKQGRKAAAPAASSILTGRRLALAQVARIPTQIANSLLALRHRADARRTSAKFAVRLIVAQLHGPTVSVLPTPNSEEPFSVGSPLSLQFPSQSPRRPYPSDPPTLRISAQQIACGLPSPAGFLPALLLVVVACGSSTWPAQISPTLRALILNLSTVQQAESHI